MAELSNERLEQLQQGLSQLQASCKTLLLSTLSTDTVPELSYAPYAKSEQGAFYIFISELAAHTANLQCHPVATVLFIQDERDSRNLYARERLSWRCSVRKVERDTKEYQQGLALLTQAQGQMVDMLRTLADFHLFVLVPQAGSYVVGFGQAYEVEPVTGLLMHIDEQRLGR